MNFIGKPHKIGYIGFGSMAGGYHYDTAMRDDVPFSPAAVFDINPDRRAFAQSKGLTVFDNLRDFLDSRLFDFVLVATSNQYHCPMTCAALEAGYNVMCEKPAAMSSQEIEKMIAASKKSGKLFTVHQNRRWDRDFLILKQSIENGDVGKPFVLENRICSANGTAQMQGWRRMRSHGGGMLLDWGVHMLDQMLYLVAEPVKSVYANVFPLRSGEVDDYAKVVITFESGLAAQVEASTFSPCPLPKWYACGSEGAILIPDISGNGAKVRRIKQSHTDDGTALAYTDDKVHSCPQDKFIVDEWEELTLPHTPIPQDWASLYKNVAAALDGKEPLVVTPESVLRCFKVIEAAVRSSEEKRSIEF